MRGLILILTALVSLNASATLKVLSVTGVSSSKMEADQVTILGGTAGVACLSDRNVSTCNNCASQAPCTGMTGVDLNPLCSCNTQRIADNSVVTITVAPTNKTNGLILIAGNSTTTSSLTLPQALPSTGTSVSFFWRDACQLAGSIGMTCEGQNLAGTLSAFVDENNDGIQDNGEETVQVNFKTIYPGVNMNVFGSPTTEGLGQFSPMSGNGEVLLSNINVTTGFPNLSYGSTVQAIRVFVSDKDMLHATAGQAVKTVDLAVSADGSSLPDSAIHDLANGKLYFFRLGLVDEAGNLVQHFPDMISLSTTNPDCMMGTANATCPYAATPAAN